jgi:hypothetical protein
MNALKPLKGWSTKNFLIVQKFINCTVKSGIMKKNYNSSKNLNRLTQYSAMATCLLAIKTTDGQVVY